ncbi:MAG: SGNH/GDSL hydrolase family protein [Pseudomonadota bacterium]
MRVLSSAILGLAILGLWLAWDEIPAWRWDGTAIVPIEELAAVPSDNLCPAPGQTIEFRGDSLAAGGRMGTSQEFEALPYGRIVERELGDQFPVIIRARGGFTAAMGEEAWGNIKTPSSLVMIAFGTNDAAPRGWMRERQPVPLSDFEASLTAHVERAQNQGSKVALLAPPPGGSIAINQRLHPYRQAVARVAQSSGIAVLDPAAALAQCSNISPPLTFDALHLNVEGHRCMGRWLAEAICPSEPN